MSLRVLRKGRHVNDYDGGVEKRVNSASALHALVKSVLTVIQTSQKERKKDSWSRQYSYLGRTAYGSD